MKNANQIFREAWESADANPNFEGSRVEAGLSALRAAGLLIDQEARLEYIAQAIEPDGFVRFVRSRCSRGDALAFAKVHQANTDRQGNPLVVRVFSRSVSGWTEVEVGSL